MSEKTSFMTLLWLIAYNMLICSDESGYPNVLAFLIFLTISYILLLLFISLKL